MLVLNTCVLVTHDSFVLYGVQLIFSTKLLVGCFVQLNDVQGTQITEFVVHSDITTSSYFFYSGEELR